MLTEAAFQAGIEAAQSAGRGMQRERGQFMTPGPIAEFMAARALAAMAGDVMRVLEPAAGTGVLIAAAVQTLLARDVLPGRIEILAYELDSALMPLLADTCAALTTLAAARKVELRCVLRNEDFLLSALARTGTPVADVVIANPPYFKLPASDARASAHRYALYGQPNIYGLFMAACARLVRAGGRYCFITPRSWTNGAYFSAVRQVFFDRLSLHALHLFDSRRESFRDDDVLQETLIVWAGREARARVECSSSTGIADLGRCTTRSIEPAALVRGAERVLVLPHEASAPAAVMPGWSESLGSLGLSVSTGPTVAFRARAHLCAGVASGAVPLLWMQHVRRDGIRWPLGRPEEQVRVGAATGWMLLRSAPMVLLRRFSPKEDARRVTAVAYLGELPCDYLALENHLNFVHRKGGSMSPHEAIGLAAVLNSAPVDAFLRGLSGSTQVNAADLRRLPLPPLEVIAAIGRELAGAHAPLARVDEVVARLGAAAGEPGRMAA